ncbi:MAG: DUF402 domain-containing protein [Thermoanaerobacteraceae bacterium]|nr:DUF402 domain-containing protein [Thermoanaerobacteraceae bacterium]
MVLPEHAVVKLKDGREGTIVYVYGLLSKPKAYEIEIEDGIFVTAKEDEIADIIWMPPKEDQICTVGYKICITKVFITDREPMRWLGNLIYRDKKTIAVQTTWVDDYDLGLFKVQKKDEGLEIYFKDRMFNLFRIMRNGSVVGYYINMSSPVREYLGELEFTDYAIDICISPDGRYEILDMDEYEEFKDRINEDQNEKMLREFEDIKKSLESRGVEYINEILVVP